MKKEVFLNYLKVCAKHFQVDVKAVLGSSKNPRIVSPRRLLFHLCLERGMKPTEVARYMREEGARTNHSSVSRGDSHFKNKVNNDPDYAKVKQDVINLLVDHPV